MKVKGKEKAENNKNGTLLSKKHYDDIEKGEKEELSPYFNVNVVDTDINNGEDGTEDISDYYNFDNILNISIPDF